MLMSFKEFIQEGKLLKAHLANEFRRNIRKLKKAKSDAERLEINAELMLLAKLMNDKDAVRALRNF